jgi:hypothetical protein
LTVPSYRFGEFILSPRRRVLTRNGREQPLIPRYFDLPARTAQKFRIAQMGVKPETLLEHGWEVAPGEIVSRTPDSYREFIQGSRGEFSVPKNGYVAMRS